MFSYFFEIIQFLSQVVHWIANLFPFLLKITSSSVTRFSSLSSVLSAVPSAIGAIALLTFSYYMFDFIRGR